MLLYSLFYACPPHFWSDFDGVALTVLPGSTVVGETVVTLKCMVSAVPAATEICLSSSAGLFFLSSNGNLNRSLGTVTVNDANHLEYKFTADLSWNGNVSCTVRNPTHRDTSTVTITVLCELYYLQFGFG